MLKIPTIIKAITTNLEIHILLDHIFSPKIIKENNVIHPIFIQSKATIIKKKASNTQDNKDHDK